DWHDGLFANGSYLDTSARTVRGIHYTQYPTWFGDLEARSDYPAHLLVRRQGSSRTMWTGDGRPEVPFRACTDEDISFATCRRDDRGADAYEIGLDRIQRYYAYYHNTHFIRGRLWVDPPEITTKYTDFFLKLTATHLINSQSVPDKAILMSDDGF